MFYLMCGALVAVVASATPAYPAPTVDDITFRVAIVLNSGQIEPLTHQFFGLVSETDPDKQVYFKTDLSGEAHVGLYPGQWRVINGRHFFPERRCSISWIGAMIDINKDHQIIELSNDNATNIYNF